MADESENQTRTPSETGGARPYQQNYSGSTGPTTERKRIGVSDKYTPPDIPQLRQLNEIGASANFSSFNYVRYYDGDEYDKIKGLSPTAVAELQLRLVELGLLNGKVKLGVWDNSAANAFKQVLAQANMNGTDWDQALELMLYSAAEFGEYDPEGSSLPKVRVSNPDDIRAIFRKGAKEHLGSGNLDPAFVERMVSAYQSMEAGAQSDAQSGAMAPSGDVFVENELKKANPERYDSRKVVEGLREVHDFLGGGGGA